SIEGSAPHHLTAERDGSNLVASHPGLTEQSLSGCANSGPPILRVLLSPSGMCIFGFVAVKRAAYQPSFSIVQSGFVAGCAQIVRKNVLLHKASFSPACRHIDAQKPDQ